MHERRGVAGLGLGLDALPLLGEALDVRAQFVLGGTLGGGADDNPGVLRDDLLEDLLQARALGIGSLREIPVIEPSGT